MKVVTREEIKQEIANKVYLCVNTLVEAEKSSPIKFYKILRKFCMSYFNFEEEVSFEELIEYLHHHRTDMFINHKNKEDLIKIIELVIQARYSGAKTKFKEIKDNFLSLVSNIKENLLDIKIKELSFIGKIKIKIMAKRAKVLLQRAYYATELRNLKKAEKIVIRLENLYSRIKDNIDLKDRHEFDRKLSNIKKAIRNNMSPL